MPTKTPKRPIQVEYKTLVIIWAALLMSQALFLVVVYLARPQLFAADMPADPFGGQPLLILIFAAAALLVVFLSFVLRKQHMKRAMLDKDASCVQTGLLLGCALSEFSSLLGLILALAFEYPYFYAWIALGTLGILLHFPRRHNLEAAQ